MCADWQRQLQICQPEIGFKPIRFHGLLSDDIRRPTGVPPGKYELQRWQVGYHHNDAYTAYLEMGAPRPVDPRTEQALRAASRGELEARAPVEISATGGFSRVLSMHENDMVLLKLLPEKN